MDDNSFYGAPAGWYPDPLGLPQLRWWDSTAWTHQTAEARAPMVMQETTFAWPDDDLDDDQELPTRRERREQERRDNIGTPEPTSLTLLELEPPSIDEVQEPVPESEPEPYALSEPASAVVPDVDPSTLSGTRSVFSPEFSGEYALQVDHTVNDDDDSVDDDDPGSADIATPSPLAANRATSLQDQAASGDAGTDYAETDHFRSEVGQPGTSTQNSRMSAFDWSASDASAVASADRSSFLTYQSPAPTVSAVADKGTHNVAVWIIALVPLIQLVVSLLVLTAVVSSVIPSVMAGIWLVPYPLVIILAAIDRALLKRSGHKFTANWLWALLTAPIYLIVRAVASIRESGGGFGPILVWTGLGLLHLASIVAVPGLLISAMPTVFAQQAEQSIISDAAIIGAKLTVTCPPPAVMVGQTFNCAGKTSAGKSLDIQVSLQRANGWINWRVDDWGIYTLG